MTEYIGLKVNGIDLPLLAVLCLEAGGNTKQGTNANIEYRNVNEQVEHKRGCCKMIILKRWREEGTRKKPTVEEERQDINCTWTKRWLRVEGRE